MTCDAFFEYITNCFYRWLLENSVKRPVVLFLDGHTSHISLALSEFCKKEKIILVALLPNSTHVLQPLDVAVFKPVKQEWRNTVHEFRIKNEQHKIRRTDFPGLVKKCFDKTLKTETIKSGFRSCGIFPFDPNNVDFKKLLGYKKDTTNAPVNHEEILIENSNFKIQFEKRLTEMVLKEFRDCEFEVHWNGDTTYEKIFLFWKSITKPNTEENVPVEVNYTDLSLNDTTLINNLADDWIDFDVEDDGSLKVCENPAINVGNIDEEEHICTLENNISTALERNNAMDLEDLNFETGNTISKERDDSNKENEALESTIIKNQITVVAEVYSDPTDLQLPIHHPVGQ